MATSPSSGSFWIESSSTGATQMIGSECARNYIQVDLVEAYERHLNRAASRQRAQRRRDEAIRARNEAVAAREAQRQVENAAWTTEHATEVAWLAGNHEGDSFLTSLFEYHRMHGRLTNRQLECVQTNIQRASTPRPTNAVDRAATPDQVPHIYNGTYTVDNGSRHMTYRIYTATLGPLQGKRIVKKQNQYGQFEGFGFVGTDGGLVLWRRYREQANELFVTWASTLLNVLNARGTDAPGVDTINHTLDGWQWTIQRTRACRRCNRELTVPTSIETGIGPECARRSASENRTTVADHHEGGNGAVAEPVARRRTPPRRQPASWYAALDQSAPVATQQLALSELGSGELQ